MVPDELIEPIDAQPKGIGRWKIPCLHEVIKPHGWLGYGIGGAPKTAGSTRGQGMEHDRLPAYENANLRCNEILHANKIARTVL